MKISKLDLTKHATMGSNVLHLNAETVDVYQGAHWYFLFSFCIVCEKKNSNFVFVSYSVIFMFDPKKEWTFDYVEREAQKVPKHILILILVSFFQDKIKNLT